jgi:hypothetical protein
VNRRVLWIVGLFFLLGSCSNAWRDFPDKSSDQYYIDQAKIHLNQFEFDKAIERISPVLAKYPKNTEVVQIAMLSHAGRAGLRVLDLILALASDVSSSTFFRIFAEHFPNADDDDVEDLMRAIEILETYQLDAALRNTEFNLIAMFLYYGQIGVILHRYAYVNNAIWAQFDQCNLAHMPDDALTFVVQSLPKALSASSNLSGSGGVSGALDALTSAPEIQAFVGAENATCPTDNAPCQSMRSLIGEGDLGIGLGSGVPVACP